MYMPELIPDEGSVLYLGVLVLVFNEGQSFVLVNLIMLLVFLNLFIPLVLVVTALNQLPFKAFDHCVEIDRVLSQDRKLTIVARIELGLYEL